MFWSNWKNMICCTPEELRKHGKKLMFPVVVEYENGYKSKVVKRSNYKKFLQKADDLKPRKKPTQLSLF
jgi:hypothetical protein